MATFNHVEFFRFSGGYEEVFKEDNGYLYVCAEPWNWAHFLACNHYQPISGKDGEYMREDTSGADIEYLQSLTPAPVEIAREIIAIETRRMLQYEDMSDDEKEAYLEYKLAELEGVA